MVRHYFPQSANGEVATNSNFPPQSGAENTSSPVGGTMEYEDFVGMEYEDNDDMDYESAIPIPDNWFDTDYKQRNLITINTNQVPSTQTNFPFLLNEISNSDFTVMKANGEDVRFTSLSGLTVFDVEIEEADNNSGDLISWSKIPSMSNGTQFYVYYNKPSAASAGTSETVWSDYKAVYHLNQTVLGVDSTKDSTGNNNDGTPQNLLVGDLQATGQIDGSIDFPGVDEFVDIADDSSLNIVNDITMEAWIKAPSVGFQNGCIFERTSGGTLGYRFVFFDRRPFMVLFTTPSGGVSTGGATTINDDTLHHTLVRKNSAGDLEVFLDGVKDNAVTPVRNEPITDANTNAALGGENVAFYKGILDEVRISSNALSNDFITTEFNNQSAPSSFYTISSAETI